MAAYLHTMQTLRTHSERSTSHRELVNFMRGVNERREQPEVLDAEIREALRNATCDHETAINSYDSISGQEADAVRCGASADCGECFLCAGHCDCKIYGQV